jgi:antitoxin component YwqK of YwqJK toxin-antitoxin module
MSIENIKCSPEILQHILNPYLNYLIDIPQIQNSIKNLKFLKSPHIEITNSFFSNNKVMSTVTYLDGEMWRYVTWYMNGHKYMEQNFQFNQLNEKEYKWHPNGQKLRENNYQSGLREGKQYEWFLNSKLKSESHYQKGVLEGKQLIYYENGKLASRSIYKNGSRMGRQLTWCPDGKLEAEWECDEMKLI